MNERAPSITQVMAAAGTLARALEFEAIRVREEGGHLHLALAQGATRVRNYANQLDTLRRGRQG